MAANFCEPKVQSDLIARHAETLRAALEAVGTRGSWSPFSDSPSTKIHGADKPRAGKAAFEALLGKPFELAQPGILDWVGAEVSPFTRRPLGVTYPRCDPQALIEAGQSAVLGWRHIDPELRISVCLEIAQRLYDRNFEMAQAVMHVAGQSYVQAFSGSGPNALDRGVEALAYAAKAMSDVPWQAEWRRRFGAEEVALKKNYTLMPRGVGLVICCASFPTWNAYPALFANLATGNAAIVKPHPIAILPMAIVVQEARSVLAEHGFDPNLVSLAVDTLEEPVAQRYVDDPAIGIVDFTGSPRYGTVLEQTVTGKLLFTETAGVNSVVLESVEDLTETARAIARSTALFSSQMCTSPQVVFVPQAGLEAGGRVVTVEAAADAIAAEIQAIADDPVVAAGIMGAIQGEVSMAVVDQLRIAIAETADATVVRDASPYPHPDFPEARTLTTLVAIVPEHAERLYAEEQFGPVLLIVPVADRDAAIDHATRLAKQRGAISTYLYSTDEAFIDGALGRYEEAGANLSINLHGSMWINFAAAYSDYHVTGLNPAGNACLADLAFVAARFRIVQRRRPA
jgi:phenylacetic acid degradation protein paaN